MQDCMMNLLFPNALPSDVFVVMVMLLYMPVMVCAWELAKYIAGISQSKSMSYEKRRVTNEFK